MSRILVLGSKVPFTSGGQEVLVRTLVSKLKKKGHEADSLDLPDCIRNREDLFKTCMLWRSLSFDKFGSDEVDLIISTKFPTYYAKHENKSIWLVHQYRNMYDLYGGNFSDFNDTAKDEAVRQLITDSDNKMISEAKYVSGISKNVVQRLEAYNHITADVLYPPLPLENRYKNSGEEDYILSVGRICTIKRIDLIIKALSKIRGEKEIKLKIVGIPDEAGIMEYLNNEIASHHIQSRVEFLGRVSDEELLHLYSKAICVYYAPYDEDYGYVTLEALASGKPVVTAKDSGGVLEFIKDKLTGVVVDPTPEGISKGCNLLINDADLRSKCGQEGMKLVSSLKLSERGWDFVIEKLLSPLKLSNK